MDYMGTCSDMEHGIQMAEEAVGLGGRAGRRAGGRSSTHDGPRRRYGAGHADGGGGGECVYLCRRQRKSVAQAPAAVQFPPCSNPLI
eukprot:347502-Chlamydomonas_euryale.AAC.1